MSSRVKHRWSEDDDTIGYYLCRFGDKDLTFTKRELAEVLGMGWNSMGLKVSNFRALDGKGTMDGYSLQSTRIYNRYKETSDTEFREIGIAAMARCLSNRSAASRER